jgi:signal transduction histidine kinase/Tfp pilus assembly protein PilF
MKYLIIFLLFLTFHSQDFSQSFQKPKQANTPLQADISLFNNYMESADRAGNDSVKYYLQKAFHTANAAHYNKGLAQYYHFLAAEFNENNHYDSAMQVINKEISSAQQSGDTASVAWAYNALANTYEFMGELDSAVTYFIKALKISAPIENENTKLTGTLNYNLASALYLTEDYKRAISYAEKGYQVGLERNDVHMMSNSLLDIGSINVGLENYDSALSIFNRVIKLVAHTPDSNTIMDALNDEGDIYARQKKYKRALEKYEQMSALALRDNNQYELLYAYGNLGITQFQMNDFNEAARNLTKAIQIGRQLHSGNELRQFYKSLSEVEEARHKYALSLHYLKKYDSLNNALMNESSKKNIHLLETKYRTSQKNKEIAQQKLILTQRQRAIERKNTWIFISLGGLIALIVILILSIRTYRHKKKLHEQSMMTLKKQHELDTLTTNMKAREEERNRIGKEMHDDVGSALTTILYLSNDIKSQASDSNKNTAERIAGTAGMVMDKMNEIIWSMNPEYNTLDDLIAYSRRHASQFLENYGINYCFKTPEPVPDIHLQGEQRRNIFLVIKESLHNIVKHACASEVNIVFEIKKDLIVMIHDNGKGIDMEELRRFGNGLRNMRQRMESVGGNFEILNDNGTIVKVTCPLDATRIEQTL